MSMRNYLVTAEVTVEAQAFTSDDAREIVEQELHDVAELEQLKIIRVKEQPI